MKIRLFYLFLTILFSTCNEKKYNVEYSEGPLIRHISSDTATVVWAGNMQGKMCLYYGKVETDKQTCVQPVMTKGKYLIEGLYKELTIYFYKVELSGLEPDTDYKYRIGSRENQEFTFRTFPTSTTNFNFVIYGDTRTNADVHRRIIEKMAADNPKFVFNTGDLVDSGIIYSDGGIIGWKDFIEIIKPIASKMPFYPVFGNHDSGGEALWDGYFPVFSTNPSTTFYSFDYSNIHFIILNTEIDFKPGSNQYVFFEDDLMSATEKKTPFIIALFHRPPYSSSEHGQKARKGDEQQTADTLTYIVPLLEKYSVDIAFNGHDHNYERTVPIKDGKKDENYGTIYIVAGGGGAPLYDAGREWWTVTSESTYHYIQSVVSDGSIDFTVKGIDDGKIIDTFSIKAKR